MKREFAEAMRDEILAEVGRTNLVQGAELHSLAKQQPSDQLAVGFSRAAGKKMDYRIELRVQRQSGKAFEIAKKYRDEYQQEVHLQVVPQVDLLPNLDELRKPDPSAKLPNNHRALRIGLSVSRLDMDAGTLGAFVQVKGEDGEFVLSCNHVLAKLNSGTKGDDIYHPGKPDQKPLGLKFRVAKLDEFIDLALDDLNQSDAALARISPDVDHDGTVIPAGLPNANKALKVFSGDPLNDIRRGQEVCKIGRTTGRTSGKVTGVGLGPLPIRTSKGKMLFGDIIEVVGDNDLPFSKAGDSGSLVFLSDAFEAIGLVFAGGPVIREDGTTANVTYVCQLAGILGYFEAKLV